VLAGHSNIPRLASKVAVIDWLTSVHLPTPPEPRILLRVAHIVIAHISNSIAKNESHSPYIKIIPFFWPKIRLEGTPN
jgi:hypothetical protein